MSESSDLDDEQFIRQCSIKSMAMILKKFQPEDFDKIYFATLSKYNKHYAPYASFNNKKSDWNKDKKG